MLGIDLGGTNIKAVWTDAEGNVVRRETRHTGDCDGTAVWMDEIWALSQSSAPRIGIAAPGLATKDGRAIAFMPGRLRGLEGLDWSAYLGRKASVLNDAHAALLGEVWQGAARGRCHVVMLTLGTGVGGAVLINGRLLRGAIGRAGHLGHISLNAAGAPDITGTPGSLEDAIGECTVQRRTGFASTKELVQAVRAGSSEAHRDWNESVQVLAAAITSLINAFDPEVVLLGGGITAAGEALFSPLHAHLDSMEWRPAGHRVPVVRAQLGEWAGAYGAAFHGAESDLLGHNASPQA
ncbi:ROK family protein [Verrucomicrobia bacterium LW23]|nr:ROK family protein [Verrucomicrobia bacterium LW23]